MPSEPSKRVMVAVLLGQVHRPSSHRSCKRMCNARKAAQGAASHCIGQVTVQAAQKCTRTFANAYKAWFKVA